MPVRPTFQSQHISAQLSSVGLEGDTAQSEPEWSAAQRIIIYIYVYNYTQRGYIIAEKFVPLMKMATKNLFAVPIRRYCVALGCWIDGWHCCCCGCCCSLGRMPMRRFGWANWRTQKCQQQLLLKHRRRFVSQMMGSWWCDDVYERARVMSASKCARIMYVCWGVCVGVDVTRQRGYL